MAADPNDPYKQQENLHKSATDVAKAVSDAYYKVDSALLNLPAGNAMAAGMKAIRDNLFVQKQQAEKILQQASDTLSNTPKPAPEPPKEPAPAPAGAPTPTAPPAAAPVASARVAAGVPTVQAETVMDAWKKGASAKAGSLSTDGTTVTLGGKPILKREAGKVLASWGAEKPSMVVAANLNSIGAILGVGRIAKVVEGQGASTIMGSVCSDWAEVCPDTKQASVKAAIPSLLLPKI